jgi:hypothetical protein
LTGGAIPWPADDKLLGGFDEVAFARGFDEIGGLGGVAIGADETAVGVGAAAGAEPTVARAGAEA